MLALGRATKELMFVGGGCRHLCAIPTSSCVRDRCAAKVASREQDLDGAFCAEFISDLWAYLCTLSSIAILQKPLEALSPESGRTCRCGLLASGLLSPEAYGGQEVQARSTVATTLSLLRVGGTWVLKLSERPACQGLAAFLESFSPPSAASSNSQGRTKSCARRRVAISYIFEFPMFIHFLLCLLTSAVRSQNRCSTLRKG